MERAHSYIQEIKENIRRVLDLPPCASEVSLPPGPRRDPRSIIASLQNHLEAVLAGTSNSPMDVASIVGDKTTVPSSSEQDPAARRRGNAAASCSFNRSELELAARTRGDADSLVRSQQEPAARARSEQETANDIKTDVSCYILNI